MVMSDETIDVIKRLQESVGHSKRKLRIIEELNKRETIFELRKRLRIPAPTMSKAISSFKARDLVIKLKDYKNSEVYDKIPLLKQLNIRKCLRMSLTGQKLESKYKEKPSKRISIIAKKSTSKSFIDELNIDKEIRKDCFPLRYPYRHQVAEAFLTVENRMRGKLRLDDSRIGVDIISDAAKLGIFKQHVPSEEQGVEMLYRASVLWFRNRFHHRKITVSKDEALELIIFANYLLKLFEFLVAQSKIKH